MEPTAKQKKQIIENSIRSLKQEEFDLTIRKDVFKETGMDENRLEEVTEQLVQNRKMQAAYEKKLKKLDPQEESE